MHFTLHQLKVLATCSQAGSMTKAAEKLHMTQPAVSIQIKKLEDACGLHLFEVIGKTFFLTQAGKAMLQTYLNIEQQLETLEMELFSMKGMLKGILRIAVVSTASYFAPEWLGAFKQSYPDIAIKLEVTNRQSIIERLKNNLDDMVIMSQIPQELAIQAYPVLQDSLLIAAAPTHPLTHQKKISWENLAKEHFIVREKGSGTRMVMERLFKKHKMQPNIVMELGSNEAIKHAMIAGIGLSLVSEASIQHELRLKKLTVLNITHLPLQHPWYAVYLKEKKLSPIAQGFLKFLQDKVMQVV